tara:strand:+ start:149 stop:373 length:225 start_codon:yes stop_codon:yes gene_type:complete
MSWYDPLKPNSRNWNERSATGKKIYVIFYIILLSFLGLMIWIGEFSEEAQKRNQNELIQWQKSQKIKDFKPSEP